MDQEINRELSAAREHASAAVSAAIVELNSMPVGAERSRNLRGLATLLLAQPEEFRATAILQCPELETAEPLPDTLLDLGQAELFSQLTQFDLEAIDAALVRSSALPWRSVARVIGGAMVTLDGRFPEFAIGPYVRRVVALVEAGRLLGRGNLEFIRLSEVRLPVLR